MHPKPAADDDTGVTKPLQSAPSTTGGALCRASLGHELGDRLLVQIAARLQKVLEPRAGRVYRLDGLSFACLIENDSGDADARLLLASLTEAMDCPFVLDQQELVVTINLGAAAYPRHANTAAGVARHIQLAVRDARAHPGNSYRLFDEVLAQQQREQLRLEAKLAQALDRGELQLHYQPQRDLRSGALLGFEALLRWTTAEGPVSPAVFIPLAEDSGRIIEIGRWVLQHACRQARAWRDTGLGRPVVSVNVSPRQFQHPGFLDSVREALDSSGADPAQIELEITEGAVMGDAESTIRNLHALRELGLQLAIDDFGTGYASLSYLRRFPLNRLKIDQSFIRPLCRSQEDQAIVEALIQLSHSLGLHVVAEGVETAEQQACLTELGCDAMQGYWYARPGPVDAATALLEQQQFRPPGSA
jgi:EAL domain-containing protein (putative c-di-GMP-specific phosphodiesterase class I)